jgi:hypothetical protein
MKTYVAVLLVLLTVFTVSRSVAQEKRKQLPMAHMAGLLGPVETIPLPTEGWMDHLAVDLKSGRTVIRNITGLGGNPRKPFFDPRTNLVWVDLGDNTLIAIDAGTLEIAKTVELTGGKGAAKRDPDNGAYDYARGLYYSGVGTSGSMDGTVEIVDTRAGKLVGSIAMHGSDPSAFVLDAAGNRLYVGMGDVVNGESVCKVIDTEKREVIAEAHHRRAAAARRGARFAASPPVVWQPTPGRSSGRTRQAGGDELGRRETHLGAG